MQRPAVKLAFVLYIQHLKKKKGVIFYAVYCNNSGFADTLSCMAVCQQLFCQQYERRAKTGMSQIKGKRKRRNYEQYMSHPVRPYTDTSDALIVQMINEWGYKPAQIAYVLYRDKDDVARHIQELRQTGKFQQIHQTLLDTGSLYAIRVNKQQRNQKTGQNRFALS
jgi:hypothetical protein